MWSRSSSCFNARDASGRSVRTQHAWTVPGAALQAAAAAEVAQLNSSARCDERAATRVRRHDVLHGDVAWTAPTAVPLRASLKVLFSNAFELEVVKVTVGMLLPGRNLDVPGAFFLSHGRTL